MIYTRFHNKICQSGILLTTVAQTVNAPAPFFAIRLKRQA